MRDGFVMRRLLPAAIALGGVVFASWLFLPRDVELLVALPEHARAARSFDLRVTRVEDGAEALRSRRTKTPDARSLLVRVKLPRGAYALDVWPEGRAEALQGRFSLATDDAVDVTLR